jgi:hypothetical protein
MAKLIKIYENGIEQTILTFRGKEFTETMVEDEEGEGYTVSKEKCLEYQVEKAFKDDPDIEEILDVVLNLSDPYDVLEELESLDTYE